AGPRDTIPPASAARRASRRIPYCEFHLVECNHFELHLHDEPAFASSIAAQVAFLNRHVGVVPLAPARGGRDH
ncbi:MAG TPA: alpha/beta hydrolase, partial [Cupriavidus sp.]|nr:alpha/beta hydrolase [Cupriavidus sp.]